MVALLFAFTAAVNAQTPQSNFEGYVGAQYDRSSFDFRTVNTDSFKFNRGTDTVGGVVDLTGYFAKNVGVTGQVAATFDGRSSESTSLVTALGGLTFKARSNARFQPYARVLAGVARQRTAIDQIHNFTDTSDVNFAGKVGVGLDVNLKENSRYKWRLIGVDYMRTSAFSDGVNGFVHGNQNHLTLTTGFVF